MPRLYLCGCLLTILQVPTGQKVGDTQRIQNTQTQRSAAEQPSPSILPGELVDKHSSPPDKRRFYFDRETVRDLHPGHKWRDEQAQISFVIESQGIDCHCTKKFAGMTVRFNAAFTLSILII